MNRAHLTTHLRALGILGWSLIATLCLGVEPVVVDVGLRAPGPRTNPRMYGIFLEEINHGIDGGLYAELVRNRGFEDSRPPEGYQLVGERFVDAGGFDSGFDEFGYSTERIPFWRTWPEQGSGGNASLEREGGVTKASAYCVKLTVTDPGREGFGLANEGFFGIGVKQETEHELSFYTRGKAYGGAVWARLFGPTGEAISNKLEFVSIGDDWNKFSGTLIANQTTSHAKLVVALGSSGTIWLDFVSLMPSETWRNEPNGVRPDIAEMIANLRPGFVRFPGGCVVEGGTVETAYNWKLTVGPVEQRHERWGPWNQRRTNGMGIYEYLRFCEDLDAEPLWVGFCGQTCIFRNREHVPMSQMEWVRDGFLDLIEYANGAASTQWGAQRVKAGHQEPFGLQYIEIGNENQGREYAQRYQYIHHALTAKYPQLTYLGDLSWTSRESMEGSAFDIIDRHYYSSTNWFVSRYHEYDQRSRDLPPLYLGEVAVTSGDAGQLRGNLQAALAEGVFLLGCERNADVVQMVSYAPLLANVRGRTALTGSPPPWHAMIYFDGTRVFGTASYYLWKMFCENRPDQVVQTKIEPPNAKPPLIAGEIGIGTWDATADFKDIQVTLPGGDSWYPSGLSGDSRGGSWSNEDGVHRQQRRGRALAYFGDADWSNYTLTLQAKKHSGSEGFLIVFGRQDDSQFWWNLGGWGNSQHAIEHNQNLVGRGERGHIDSDRWYAIKIELDGDRIRCFLNNELVHDVRYQPLPKFFADAGVDESQGEIVIKAINLAQGRQAATVRLHDSKEVASAGTIVTLSSERGTDNNSLDEPRNVLPVEQTFDLAGPEFRHEFLPQSFTVIRIPFQSAE